jgi:hypothetical protein
MQLKRVAKPFGEVNVFAGEKAGFVRVKATVPIGVFKEGAQTGIALDASGSMGELYSDFTGRGNAITPVAQSLCSYLAQNVDADGGTTAIYWALGASGDKIQVIGDLTAEQAAGYQFTQPGALGNDTRLTKAVQYFEERFRDSPWGIYVFLTDGQLKDMAELKDYSRKLARQIKAGERNPLKLVLVGVGTGIDETQMKELDDLFEGTDLPDLWDHKIAKEMRGVTDIFAEVVNRNTRVAASGKVVVNGQTVEDYSDTGVPQLVEFWAPAAATYFTLVADGRKFNQGLSDSATPPPSDPVAGSAAPLPGVAPGTAFTKEVAPIPGIADSGGGGLKTPAAATDEITDFDVSGFSGKDAPPAGKSLDVTDSGAGGTSTSSGDLNIT